LVGFRRFEGLVMQGWRLFVLFVAAALTASCGGTTSSTTVPPAATTSTTQIPSTTTAPTTTTTTPAETVVALPTVSALEPPWVELFHIPYGPTETELGSSPGGEAGSMELGPDYGAQTADGTWWFLDAAKQRLAHYSETGEYLSAVSVTDHLVDGKYFQFQLPHALDDGSVVMTRMGFGTSTMLVLHDGDTEAVTIPATFSTRTDDGTNLYGFSDEGDLLRADPGAGTAEPVDWMLTKAGTRFRITSDGQGLTVELPDGEEAPSTIIRFVYADDPTVVAHAGFEVASGVDGSLFLYLYGGTDSGVGGQLGGFLTISPDGDVAPLEPTRDPFSPSDPGSPAHLGVRPGTSTPWLMFVDPDGVRVFAREG
jgi:hypothetical protein